MLYTLAQSNGGGLGGILFMVFMLAVMLVLIAAMWKVFTKAGKPGWASLIPIYNLWVMVDIAGKGALWFVLYLIPGLNAIAAIVVSIGIAEQFGKGTGFGIGLAFLPFIFVPLLGFGDAQYVAGGDPAATAM